MKHILNKIALIIIVGDFLFFSCGHKKDTAPAPSETCYLQSEWQYGIRQDSFIYSSSNQLISVIEYDTLSGKQASVANITYNNDGAINQFAITFSADSINSIKNYYNSSGQLAYELVYTNTIKTDSIAYQYTGSNITLAIDYSVGVNITPTVSFIAYYTYDKYGNVLIEKDTSSSGIDMYVYTYDIEKIPYGTLITNAYTTTGTIDMPYLNGKNNLASMNYTVNGVTQPSSFTTIYTYNSNNYPITTYSPGGQISSSSYNYVCK